MSHQIWFVGIKTEGSVAHRAFPAWMAALDLDAQLVGVDMPLDSSPNRYRRLVADFRRDGNVLGAVITGHKARMYEHTRQDLDCVGEPAMQCQEISVLHRRHHQVAGTAIEVQSTQQALSEVAGAAHWDDTRRELLVLGAGGTANALIAAIYADRRDQRAVPRRVHLIDVVPERSRALAQRLSGWGPAVAVEEHAPAVAAAVLSALPPGSLVVNATGVGKDTPGSPIPLPAPWPEQAIFWEINYRGARPLLADAKARPLVVHDGWRLFIAGWSEALAVILERALSDQDRTAIATAASAARG